MAEPIALVSVPEMRSLEAAAIQAGTPERELQERAGRAVADVVSDHLPVEGQRIAVLVGKGNNGRDGLVAARHLATRGHHVEAWLVPGHSLDAEELVAAAGVGVRSVDPADGGVALRRALAEARVAIDGLLGIGVEGPIRSPLADVVGIVNEVRAGRPQLLVVAVDVPSGINADDGSVPGVAIHADVTVTFGGVKEGLLRFPAARLVGRLQPRGIGLPVDAIERQPMRILDEAAARALLPSRPVDAHKYRFGRVLVVAGSDAYVGAAYLCAAAAARSGCGLVAVASTEAVKRVLATRLPEATYPIGTLDLTRGGEAAADRVGEVLPDYQALLLGPGLGRSPESERFVRRLLSANGQASSPAPAVIDADGLALLARWNGWSERIGRDHVLTPHAAEMAKLTDGDPARLAQRPWGFALEFAQRWHQTVILKGPFTSAASADGQAWVYPHANPALATAGTGDVLAGLCGGLVAQGLAPFDAARLGVVVHSLAGRRVVDERHWRTLLASDLLEEIPRALQTLEQVVV